MISTSFASAFFLPRSLKRFPRRAVISRARRGSVVPLVAVSSTVLVGFAALAIDVGYYYNTCAELQRTADASALGAAAMLANYESGNPLATSREQAQDLATINLAAGESVQLDPSQDIVFG